MRFCCLGSGSSGNSTVIECSNKKTTILVDCGLRYSDLRERLTSQSLDVSNINAVFITHEHIDHIRSAATLAKNLNLPVYMTHGCYFNSYQEFKKINSLKFFRAEQPLCLNGIKVLPFSIPHDAREPIGLIFDDEKNKLGILTDAGFITPHMIDILKNLDGLILEFNYDKTLLKNGNYPKSLKKRILSDLGHLSNDSAEFLLNKIFHPEMKVIVAAHLSKENNRPNLVELRLNNFKNYFLKKIIADQKQPTGWVSL